MKKLVIIGLVAVFSVGCTAPEMNQDIEAYGIDKDKAVNTKGDGSEYDLEDELDNSED